MITSPMPTRAEISDVSHAVREQADAIMLSGETTTGAYPLESVQVLKNIAESIEPTIDTELNSRRAAAGLAKDLEDSAIVVFTHSGDLAYWLVEPFLIEFSDDPEQTILNALGDLKARGWVDPGRWLVVITNVLAGGRIIDSLQLRQVE